MYNRQLNFINACPFAFKKKQYAGFATKIIRYKNLPGPEATRAPKPGRLKRIII
jgi:hypothetical protein